MILVLSNWDFGANNSPERIARALALNGRKVLYARNPLSIFKYPRVKHYQIAPNLNYFDTRFWGLRVGQTFLARYQWHHVAHTMERHAESFGDEISQVLFHNVFSYHGKPLLQRFKLNGLKLIHINVDVTDAKENADLADLVLSIPPLSCQSLKSKLGDKVIQIPQCGPLEIQDDESTHEAMTHLDGINTPILTYLGVPSSRLNLDVLMAIMRRNPQWTLVHFGGHPIIDLPNVMALPWMPASSLNQVLARTNVGIMPYNCADQMQHGCVPLKIFDYFARGIPVVTTPIDYAKYIANLVYVGTDVETFESGICEALGENVESPVRVSRKLLAAKHNPMLVGREIIRAITN